jgi:hypothetical protein
MPYDIEFYADVHEELMDILAEVWEDEEGDYIYAVDEDQFDDDLPF